VAQPTPGIVVRAQNSVGTKVAGGTKAVFLGDSYTTGWNGAGLGSRGWPRIVSRARGWQAVDLAVAGTGFINPGWTNQPVGSRVTEAIRQRPDVVFIAAGHNDSRWSVAATAAAADKVIDRLHRALPDALLVIVAPIWPSGSPPTRCLALRDHLRRTAASVGAIFIDPLGERWFAGSNQRFIGPDGIHPTDAGHRHMAERVLADLARAR
jgi:lysophospholipase L1-like esterase